MPFSARGLCACGLLSMLSTQGCGGDAARISPLPPSREQLREAEVHDPILPDSVWTALDGELVVSAPSGTYTCPMGPHEGVDRAMNLYLARPSECGDPFPIVHPGDPLLPSIVLVIWPEIERLTNQEVADHECGRVQRLNDLRLFGEAPLGCRIDRGDTIEIKVVALFDPYHSTDVRGRLTISLRTTRARLASDRRLFRDLVASARACDEALDPRDPGRLRCPRHERW